MGVRGMQRCWQIGKVSGKHRKAGKWATENKGREEEADVMGQKGKAADFYGRG